MDGAPNSTVNNHGSKEERLHGKPVPHDPAGATWHSPLALAEGQQRVATQSQASVAAIATTASSLGRETLLNLQTSLCLTLTRSWTEGATGVHSASCHPTTRGHYRTQKILHDLQAECKQEMFHARHPPMIRRGRPGIRPSHTPKADRGWAQHASVAAIDHRNSRQLNAFFCMSSRPRTCLSSTLARYGTRPMEL